MELEQQFLSLVKMVEGLHQKVNRLERENQILIRSQKQCIEWVEQKQQDNFYYQQNVEYEIKDSLSRSSGCFFPKISNGECTIDKIITNRKSLSRFGDGEFSVIAGRIRHRFQSELDEGLRLRLLEVLQSEEENLLVGIADNYGSLEKYTEQAKREIRCYMNPQVRREHMQLLNPKKQYYDAYVTRPYVMYADNQTDAPAKRFAHLKQIWDKRKCVFVEGVYTRLGIGNDLFDNAVDIRRILCPAENAFSQYEKILKACIQQPQDALFLLALGPTATVLAYDLCRAGYQAVDVGHIDLEYEWFLKGEGTRTQVQGKYNNEMMEEQQFSEWKDEEYLKQIIADFSER